MSEKKSVHRALARELSTEELEMVGGAGWTGGTEYTTSFDGLSASSEFSAAMAPKKDTDAGGGWDWGI